MPLYKLDPTKMKSKIYDVFLTEGLFIEKLREGDTRNTVVFNLKEHHDLANDTYSIHRLYVDIGDPTEYEAAMKILGSVDHWDKLMKCKWLKPVIKAAREELKRKIKSLAFKEIYDTALTAESAAVRLNAQKYLVKDGSMLMEDMPDNESKTKRKAGRPSTAEVKGELNRMSREEQELNADYNRIMETSCH